MSFLQKTPGTSRATGARVMIVVMVLIQCVHAAGLLLLPHPLIFSNVIQLLPPLCVASIALHQRIHSNTRIGRNCWLSVAAALSIWAMAQAIFLVRLLHPFTTRGAIGPDDALWLAFGLPLLLAIHLTHDEVDRVGLLDRLQAGLFFVVLYTLVLLPSKPISLDAAFVVQSVALLLGCLLRLPICTLVRERRFFIRLMIFLSIYAPLNFVGDTLHAHGWPPGGLVDLIWTFPATLFAIMILRDAIHVGDPDGPTRFVRTITALQGISVAALAFLSLSVSALLATRSPLLGSIAVAVCFALFALRTNGRERAWYRAHNKLAETVLQDPLTGLGNRALMCRSLEERLERPRTDESTVLIFADLDRFKHINDSLGHAFGDDLLVQLGKRLRRAAPPNSVICRHGGDEFVVLTSAQHAAHAQEIGEALLEALRPVYQLGPHTLTCTASIGVVLGRAGESAEDLLRSADHAMYRAKQVGKNCVQLFDQDLRAEISDRWQMESALRTTVEEDGIDVAFQPILSVEGGKITGFEALARWTHPLHGSVPPSRFVPLAEDSGLILQLGDQVLRKACAQVAEWNVAWDTQLSVSVNVSPRQFTDATLVARVLRILDSTGLDRDLLRLEMTESALLVNEHRVKDTLEQLRSYGIRISLDDFGTGYSSLAFLLKLPVDEVKVDRSFVADMHLHPQRLELVRTVVQLGHTLGKRVVAEGVETEQELKELAAMGCECAQGYLIGRPLTAGALEASMPGLQPAHIKVLEPLSPSLTWAGAH